MTQALVERYADRLHGVLSCYDRIVVTGTLPGVCYAQGMTAFLYARGIRIFDYPRFAEPLRDALRERAQELAQSAGIEIEHIAKAHIRKEEVVAKVLERRGDHPGLVHIISAMEACQSYQPWHDKGSGRTYLKPDTGKCLHYYFYFIDPLVGLCYLRVPTWCPFKLQFYCNGHGWLAQKLKTRRIGFTQVDNAFVRLDDFARAQQLADGLKPEQLHRILDRYAHQCCPVHKSFGQDYHWSLLQVEYATDLVFRSQETLAPLYEQLSRQAVLEGWTAEEARARDNRGGGRSGGGRRRFAGRNCGCGRTFRTARSLHQAGESGPLWRAEYGNPGRNGRLGGAAGR